MVDALSTRCLVSHRRRLWRWAGRLAMLLVVLAPGSGTSSDWYGLVPPLHWPVSDRAEAPVVLVPCHAAGCRVRGTAEREIAEEEESGEGKEGREGRADRARAHLSQAGCLLVQQ